MSETPTPPPPPSQPAPPPPSQPATGEINLMLQGSIMTTSVISPKVLVNGYQVPTSYGMNKIPMPPGRHKVEVSMQWLRTYGQASTEVDVIAGQSAPLFYAAPYHQFTGGSIGTTKQKRAGIAGLLLIVLALVALFAIPVVMMFAMVG